MTTIKTTTLGTRGMNPYVLIEATRDEDLVIRIDIDFGGIDVNNHKELRALAEMAEEAVLALDAEARRWKEKGNYDRSN